MAFSVLDIRNNGFRPNIIQFIDQTQEGWSDNYGTYGKSEHGAHAWEKYPSVTALDLIKCLKQIR